jgi:hypothetical protein
MTRTEPGQVFTMPTSVGFVIGVMTHETLEAGPLVWIASPTFSRQPSLHDAQRIESWRWPVVLALGTAITRRLVTPVGIMPIPPRLKPFPVFRSGHNMIGWTHFTEVDGVVRLLGPTTDRSLPIYKIVNLAALKEMVETNWRPEDQF